MGGGERGDSDRHRRRRGVRRRAGGRADPRGASAPPGRALRRHRRSADDSAGCEAWYPMSLLALRGYAEVLTQLPGLVRIRRALFRRLRARAGAAVHRRRRARLQSRPRVAAQARRRAHDPLRQPVGLGMAARAHRHASRARRTACWRCFRSSRRSTRRPASPVTFVGHPLAAQAATAPTPARDARAAQARRQAAGIRAAARQPDVGARDAHRVAAARPRPEIVEAQPEARIPRAAGQLAKRASTSRTCSTGCNLRRCR